MLDTPKSARHYLPEWYKKLPQWVTGKPEIMEDSLVSSKGPKTCIPFLESFTSGYVLELNQDVQVKANQDGYAHVISYQYQDIPPLDIRDQRGLEEFPVPDGFSPAQYVWKTHFAFKAPKGYSLLITHPFNRYDLPFYTLSGVVDADGGMSTGSLPFYLRADFEGIIPKGTPIAQVLPFKRENWELDRDDANLSKLDEKLTYEANSVIAGFYKKHIWKRKSFR